MNEVLSRFASQKIMPIVEKLEADPEHPEKVLTRREAIELLTNLAIRDLVKRGKIAISEKEGNFYFKWKGR